MPNDARTISETTARQAEYTPGPWVVDDNGNVVSQTARDDDGDLEVVAEVYGGSGVGLSDALLVAAAPDLLVGAIEVVEGYNFKPRFIPGTNDWDDESMKQQDRFENGVELLRAAITKARSGKRTHE